jgi:hypothetical protein
MMSAGVAGTAEIVKDPVFAETSRNRISDLNYTKF